MHLLELHILVHRILTIFSVIDIILHFLFILGKRTAVNIGLTDEESNSDPHVFPELDTIDLIP